MNVTAHWGDVTEAGRAFKAFDYIGPFGFEEKDSVFVTDVEATRQNQPSRLPVVHKLFIWSIDQKNRTAQGYVSSIDRDSRLAGKPFVLSLDQETDHKGYSKGFLLVNAGTF